MFGELVGAWNRLAPTARRRVHVVSLPMDDVEENAAIVNALQRHSAVIVQKSLAEGFGLTVAEAMWKARPVAGQGGRHPGPDRGRADGSPRRAERPAALGTALGGLLEDRAGAESLGHAAREHVADRYLVPRYLCSNLALAGRLV